jgi:hypothetical protein
MTQDSWSLPDDVVFEKAEHLPHDQLIKPTAKDSMKLEGDGSAGQIVEYLHVDENDEKFYHEMKQDVEPYLDRVKDLRDIGGSNAGKNKDKDFYLAASVPQVVIYAWLNKRGLTMQDFKHGVIDDFLNDSDNAAFRVWQGRV